MNKGLRGMTAASELRKKHQQEIMVWFKDRDFTVTHFRDYSITVRKRGQHLLTLKWVEKEGWIPELIGPTVHVLKDLDNVLSAIRANFDTIKDAQGLWELYREACSEMSWMKYQGSQCPFYQKANLWGNILDEMEGLKALALEAADLLWDRHKGCMVDIGSEHRVYKPDDFRRVNQAIYDLLGKLGYPTKEK